MRVDKQKLLGWLNEKIKMDNRLTVKAMQDGEEDDAIAYSNFALAVQEVADEVERGAFDV